MLTVCRILKVVSVIIFLIFVISETSTEVFACAGYTCTSNVSCADSSIVSSSAESNSHHECFEELLKRVGKFKTPTSANFSSNV